MEKVRIQKLIAQSGLCSRRKAEEYIESGRVLINGRKCTLGDKAIPDKDIITVDGVRIGAVRKRRLYYIMMHKPRGYVTTMKDERGRKCVTDLLGSGFEGVYPVGRLDKNSEGLLLFTNDGDFANEIMHPSHHISKTYRVTVRPDINDDQLVKLASGVELDGRMTAECSVVVLDKQPGRVVLQMTIHEGRNRQIRRMCEAVGLEVARLKRTAVGPVKLGMLKPGEFRELKPDELRAIRTAMQKKQ
ncbi:MAG: rRNA pseudouridine synthase [Ruminococcus sp.]|nr:rRNA pseudouridine synthase [Ruminococcus sp.]